MIEIIVWGATGQAKVIAEALDVQRYRIVLLVDNNPQVASSFDDVPLVHGAALFEGWLKAHPATQSRMAVTAIGGAQGRSRHEIQRYLEKCGLSPLTVTHSRAFVATDACIGAGSQICALAAVCTQAMVGEACIINTGASVDHECVLEQGVHVAPGAHLCGLVRVGAYSMVAAGATVLPRVTIGSNVIIGAGSVVTKDVPDNAIGYGVPFKIVKYQHTGSL